MAQIKDTDNFWDEYDYDNNPPIEDVNVRNDKVRWICRKDPRHVWDAKVTDRRSGQGCAVCAGKKVIPGVSDLESQFPDIYKNERKERLLTGDEGDNNEEE